MVSLIYFIGPGGAEADKHIINNMMEFFQGHTEFKCVYSLFSSFPGKCLPDGSITQRVK